MKELKERHSTLKMCLLLYIAFSLEESVLPSVNFILKGRHHKSKHEGKTLKNVFSSFIVDKSSYRLRHVFTYQLVV